VTKPPQLVIVDDFLPNPDEIRQLALAQSYAKMGSAGKRSMERFHQLIDPAVFEAHLHRKIATWHEDDVNGRFQVCTAEDPVVYHADMQTHAAVIFLTPDAPVEAGLTLVKSKTTGLRYAPADAGLSTATFDSNFFDGTKWQTVDKIGNVYNRLVLWDGQLIHAASCYFGSTFMDCRLFWMFFFNAY
jgi:hypothetical protein